MMFIWDVICSTHYWLITRFALWCALLGCSFIQHLLYGFHGNYLRRYMHHAPRTRFVVWASYQIRKIAGCACAGNAGNVFPRHWFKRKPVVCDPGMHHGTCVTHVPWCMSGSLTCGDGENVPGIPGACAPAISRIWQEAHDMGCCGLVKVDFTLFIGVNWAVASHKTLSWNSATDVLCWQKVSSRCRRRPCMV